MHCSFGGKNAFRNLTVETSSPRLLLASAAIAGTNSSCYAHFCFISSELLIASHLVGVTLAFDYIREPSRHHNSTIKSILIKNLLILKHPYFACLQSFGKESHFYVFL